MAEVEFTEVYEDVVDRTDWEEGTWEGEPDKVVWVDDRTGFDCMAKRHPRWGNWCGYVGIPKDHLLHGAGYSETLCGGTCDDALENGNYWCAHTPEAIFSVHGNITFSDGCNEEAPRELGICHIPQEGRPDDVWWFGFDCGHFANGDYAPGALATMKELGVAFEDRQVYKDLDYVVEQCKLLASQLHVYGEEGELYTNGGNTI